jgi:hypothetical protein
MVLWILSVAASFFASYYSVKHKLLSGLSFIIVMPLLAALAHCFVGWTGGTVDFRGLSGAVELLKIYFVMAGFVVIPGSLCGLLFSGRMSEST